MAQERARSKPEVAQLEWATFKERRPLLAGWIALGASFAVLAGAGPVMLGIVMTKAGPESLPDPTNALVGCGMSAIFSLLIGFYGLILWFKPSSDRQYRTGLGILIGYGLQVAAVLALIVYLFLRTLWQHPY